MKNSNLNTLAILTLAVGSVASAGQKSISEELSAAYSANKEKVSFSCGGGEYGYKGADRLSVSMAQEKALNEVKAKFPNYPWAEIEAVALEIYSSDLAISIGTSCSEYLFDSGASVMAIVAGNAQDCKAVMATNTRIDLKSCLKELTCQTVGKQSSVCE